jgi:hypothetical protein
MSYTLAAVSSAVSRQPVVRTAGTVKLPSLPTLSPEARARALETLKEPADEADNTGLIVGVVALGALAALFLRK